VVDVRVLRVFTDEAGSGGNPLGVVLDAATVLPDPRDRLEVTRRLGYSETVFVDVPDKAELRIFAPSGELPLAGHPLVGAAWLLGRVSGGHPQTLRPPGGDVASWQESGRVWIRGPLAATPAWWHERLPSAAAVAALTGPQSSVQDLVQVWAWEDADAGVVRARVFAARYGIPEDEACGSASMRLAAALGRRVTIRHGNGSVVLAQPGPPGFAEVGGLVVEDALRTINLAVP
jgi:predicted PhzF superfamily epimerase YddE/YHI9